MLAAILTPTWWGGGSGQLFTDVLVQWDELIATYEMASSEKVTDGMKVATIIAHAPPGIKAFVQSCPRTTRQAHAGLRQAIWEQVLGSRASTSSAVPARYTEGQAAMDVDAVSADHCNLCGKKGHWAKDCWFKDGKGRGKNKSFVPDKGGKAKGKDGGKNDYHGKSQYGAGKGYGAPGVFAGKCDFCGDTGHKKIECRKRIKEEGKAGTGSYTHHRAHETPEHLVCRFLLENNRR